MIVESAVKRIINDNVYPPSVDTTPAALKVSMDTQIARGNLGAQPVYGNLIVSGYIKHPRVMKQAAAHVYP